MKFTNVVDHPDGRILSAYSKLGVVGFPSYILIDPEGKIIFNNLITDGPNLRTLNLEILRKVVLEAKGQ